MTPPAGWKNCTKVELSEMMQGVVPFLLVAVWKKDTCGPGKMGMQLFLCQLFTMRNSTTNCNKIKFGLIDLFLFLPCMC